MTEILILKLGGSVITVKDKLMTANHENIKRLCEEIKAASHKSLVIVHGGGSFGHPVARKYGIADGFTSKDQVPGFARTHQAMVTLNSIIVEALWDSGLPALSVTPSSFIITDDGRLNTTDFAIVRRLADKGILPVLYGDAVLDKTKGFSILSGDQLAVHLALEMNASRLIFGVDVDGVYTSNPKLSTDARLIERLPLKELDDFTEIGRALTTDVTGGMLGKVLEVRIAVEAGVEVQIVNASKRDVIFKAMMGEPVAGTVLTK